MDFASLFQKSSSSTEAEKPANGLSSLFSDAAKQKFARSFKQTEFVPKEKEVVEEPEPEMDERLKAKREKRKLRNMKSKPGVEENGGKQPSTETPSEVKDENPETNEESQSVEPVVTEASKKEKDERTIFVGNIPISYSTDKLSKLFSAYGAIESIRLRSVPVSGAKVDKAGDQDLVRKVCVNNKKFGEQKGSVNAYIVFKDKASVSEALKANNMLLEKRHLRVDTANPSLFDPKRTLFVGGLPFYADEEEIREYFAAKLPNGQDDIDGIRLIRDNETLVGKGIGYILLKSRDLVLQALTLNDTTFKKRWTLRVSSCGKRTKRSHESSTNNTSSTAAIESNQTEDSENQPKQKKPRKEISETSLHAMKRIRTKTVMTKKKLLQSRQKGGNSSKGNKNHNSKNKQSSKGKSPKKK